MNLLNNVVLFVKNIFTIVKTWLIEFFTKYLFKNIVLLGVAFWLWFGMTGGFWTFWGWAIFWIWVGSNLESFGTIFKELKAKYNW